MPLHLGSSHNHETQESAREARRLLASKVRNDWTYPALETNSSGVADTESIRRHHAARTGNGSGEASGSHALEQSEELAAETRRHAKHQDTERENHPDLGLGFEAVAWREREFSSSETYASADSEVEFSAASLSGHEDQREGTFKFDSPDSVSHVLAYRKANKKRKRAAVLQEEMSWNAGVAHFVARRNAWTCAREIGGLETADTAGKQKTRRKRATVQTKEADLAHAASGADESMDMDVDTDDFEPEEESSDQDRDSRPRIPTAHETVQDSHFDESKTMLPIPPTLLPQHPVRARINPATYSEIYSKIILQSRTPTVPINLQDITNSLVHGWKEEGNWPPKGTVVEAPVGRRKSDGLRHPHLRKGVQAFSRVLGLGTGSGSGQREGG